MDEPIIIVNFSLYWYNKYMKRIKAKTIIMSVLFYYSAALSLILAIAGFYLAKTSKDIVNVLLFLPIPIFLIHLVIKNYIENKKIKID
jgi:hypothetical protein